MVSSFKIVSVMPCTNQLGAVTKNRMVKLQFLGNNSKTFNIIRNLTWVKMISTARSTVLLYYNRGEKLTLLIISTNSKSVLIKNKKVQYN